MSQQENQKALDYKGLNILGIDSMLGPNGGNFVSKVKRNSLVSDYPNNEFSFEDYCPSSHKWTRIFQINADLEEIPGSAIMVKAVFDKGGYDKNTGESFPPYYLGIKVKNGEQEEFFSFSDLQKERKKIKTKPTLLTKKGLRFARFKNICSYNGKNYVYRKFGPSVIVLAQINTKGEVLNPHLYAENKIINLTINEIDEKPVIKFFGKYHDYEPFGGSAGGARLIKLNIIDPIFKVAGQLAGSLVLTIMDKDADCTCHYIDCEKLLVCFEGKKNPCVLTELYKNKYVLENIFFGYRQYFENITNPTTDLNALISEEVPEEDPVFKKDGTISLFEDE